MIILRKIKLLLIKHEYYNVLLAIVSLFLIDAVLLCLVFILHFYTNLLIYLISVVLLPYFIYLANKE